MLRGSQEKCTEHLGTFEIDWLHRVNTGIILQCTNEKDVCSIYVQNCVIGCIGPPGVSEIIGVHLYVTVNYLTVTRCKIDNIERKCRVESVANLKKLMSTPPHS